jgi:hypothetical protein
MSSEYMREIVVEYANYFGTTRQSRKDYVTDTDELCTERLSLSIDEYNAAVTHVRRPTARKSERKGCGMRLSAQFTKCERTTAVSPSNLVREPCIALYGSGVELKKTALML